MLRSTSSSVVAHEQTLIRMAVRPCQTVPPHQHVPSPWIVSMTRRELARLAAVALEHLGKTRAAAT